MISDDASTPFRILVTGTNGSVPPSVRVVDEIVS